MQACDLNFGTDLHCSRQILALAELAEGSSCPATPSTNAFNAVACHHAPRLPHANPHRTRGTIARFGGPEVLELAEQPTIPDPGPGEVRIKVLAAGTGFTDTFIRRGRYPDFKGPLPFTPGYDLVGIVEETGEVLRLPMQWEAIVRKHGEARRDRRGKQ